MRDFFRALDAKTYPATVAAAFELTSVPPSEEFRFGLQLVLDESSGVAGQEHVNAGDAGALTSSGFAG